MLKDITFGQYFGSDSVIHRLDPRAKILLLIIDVVFLFLTKNMWSLLVCAFLIILVIALSRVPIKMFLKNIKTI